MDELYKQIMTIKTSQRAQHTHIRNVILAIYDRLEKLESQMQEKPKELSTSEKVEAIKRKYKENDDD